MGTFLHVLLPWAVLVSVGLSASAVLIEVPGYATRLEGTTEASANTGRPFYAFRGVFYAEQPTNLTRFLPPVPKAPYPAGVIVDATVNNLGLGCNQVVGNGIVGKENCLSLDIFTPKLRSEYGQLLPVMFWIHGGGFSSGQTLAYLPIRYMEKDVVLVVIQYRLGPLGFLCFDTDDVPGNAGIFDQIEALRWVNRHIQSFGGDPAHVVIAGESAGSASVSLLLLAPQARGLFIGAIGESGSVLAKWALDDGDKGRIASIRVAEIAGCPIANYIAMLDCVRNINGSALTKAYGIYRDEEMLQGNLGFSGSNPVIQKAGQQRIIEVLPQQLLDSGNYTKVPSFWGTNKQEGTFVLATLHAGYLGPNGFVNDSGYLSNQIVPDILKALSIDDPTGDIATAYTEKHLGSSDEMRNFTSMTPGLVDMLSVLFIKEATYQFAQASSRNRPADTFFYSFDYNARHSLFTYFFSARNTPIPHGVCHADELIYLWAFPFDDSGIQLNASEHRLSDRMIQIWTNFVTYLDPTPNGIDLIPGIPKFKPYTQQEENYMAINEDWEMRIDFTKTYTVTVDELKEASDDQRSSFGGRFGRLRHPYPF